MTSKHDVIVGGSGPAAASAAIRLASRGLDVVVIGGRGAIGPAGETAPPHTRAELVRSGFRLSALRDHCIDSYGIDASWGHRSTFSSHVFDAAGNGLHVSRAGFAAGLIEQARAVGVQTHIGPSIVDAMRQGGDWHVTIDSSGRRWTARASYLVDATGRSARIASSQGIARLKFDRLCGVALVTERPAMAQVLMVRSAPYGWWYTSPFSDSHAITCLISDLDIIRSIGARASSVWWDLLRATGLPHTSRAVDTSSPQLFPCETSILERVTGSAWLAVGDAACCLDPLASAGIMKAIYSGRIAADAIAQQIRIRDNNALDLYGASVKSDFERYMKMRALQYALETRWPNQPFWERRLRHPSQAA